MIIDVTKYTPEECLFILGDDDYWAILLRDDYPDLIITTAWRQALLEWVGTTFVRWVLKGIHHEHVDNNDPYDSSGELRAHKWDAQALKDLYPTIKEWLEEAYTGDWIATYESYYGKDWQVYGDEFEFEMQSRLSALIREQCAEQFDEAEDGFGDEVWDNIDEAVMSLHELLTVYVGKFPTQVMWERFESHAYLQIADEKNQALYLQNLRDTVDNWWKTTFPNLQHQRIEKPDYKALMLESQIEAQFNNLSHEWLQFIVSHRLSGNLSNSVQMAISNIARKVLSSEE